MATSFAPGHFKFQAEEEERGNLAPNWGWTPGRRRLLSSHHRRGRGRLTIEMDCLLLCVVTTTFQLLPFIIALTAAAGEQRSKRFQ